MKYSKMGCVHCLDEDSKAVLVFLFSFRDLFTILCV